MSELSVTDFRHRARAWLEQHAPRKAGDDRLSEPGRADIATQQAFQASLYDAGFAGLTWPREYGGQGLTHAEQIAVSQEARAFAPPFNEVFFDQVRLPADAVIGEVNDGWRAAVVMLRNERVTIGTMSAPRTSPLSYDSLSGLAARLGTGADPRLSRKLAEL